MSKISGLPAASALTGAEQSPVSQSGAAARVTLSDLSSVLVGTGVLYTNVRLSADEVVPGNAETPIPWDTEVRDDAGYWAVGSPTRFTVPAGKGGLHIITLSGQTLVAAFTYPNIRVNGGAAIAVDTADTSPFSERWCVTSLALLVAGDYVEAVISKDGSPSQTVLNADHTFFSILRIGS